MTRLRILGKLLHACLLYPELRVGQIVSNAISRHGPPPASGRGLFYIHDDLLLHALREYNKEAL